jgi:DNA-binding response OmpR family regulator
VSTDRLNTLIVDDEAPFRRVLRTSLAQSGFAIDEAQSGEEAVAILTRCAFDLVLLDMNMPGMGGVEACREIRGLAPKIGIVMVTVQDGESEIVKALEAGADDYITKPVRLRELVARLKAVLRRLRSEEAAEPTLLRAGTRCQSTSASPPGQSHSSHSHRVRSARAADAKSGSSDYAHPAVAIHLGSGIWRRIALPALFRQNPAPEN